MLCYCVIDWFDLDKNIQSDIFLSDKPPEHCSPRPGSALLITRMIYSQCGIYLNQWIVPRAIQKPRWDYYHHKGHGECRMQWKSISFKCSGHKSLTPLLVLRHWMSSVSAFTSHMPFHISAPPSKTFFIRRFVNNNLNLRFHFSKRRPSFKDFCKIFSG